MYAHWWSLIKQRCSTTIIVVRYTLKSELNNHTWFWFYRICERFPLEFAAVFRWCYFSKQDQSVWLSNKDKSAYTLMKDTWVLKQSFQLSCTLCLCRRPRPQQQRKLWVGLLLDYLKTLSSQKLWLQRIFKFLIRLSHQIKTHGRYSRKRIFNSYSMFSIHGF